MLLDGISFYYLQNLLGRVGIYVTEKHSDLPSFEAPLILLPDGVHGAVAAIVDAVVLAVWGVQPGGASSAHVMRREKRVPCLQ